MSPITHFLASWTLAESTTTTRRERLWICLAGLAPDLDGLGVIIDLKNAYFTTYVSQYFARYHHFLYHGLFGACCTVLVAWLAGVRRWKAALMIFLSFHLHLLCDLVGARGPASYDVWVIHYFGPFTRWGTFYWMHQWPLNGWQNFLITSLLLAWVIRRAIQRGSSPVSLVSPNGDAIVVETFRRWRSHLLRRGQSCEKPVT